jgi:hypothetical protein
MNKSNKSLFCLILFFYVQALKKKGDAKALDRRNDPTPAKEEKKGKNQYGFPLSQPVELFFSSWMCLVTPHGARRCS